MSTLDLFRARLDQMIDLRHPLAVLSTATRRRSCSPKRRGNMGQYLAVINQPALSPAWEVLEK